MNEYKWINNLTDEVFTSLFQAIKSALSDIKNYPKCRTIKMFNISRWNG